MADVRHVRQLSELLGKKKDLEAELKDTKAQIAELEPTVLAYFERQGMDQTRIDGRTLYLRREVYPKLCDGKVAADAIDALRKAGYEDLAPLRINWPGLGSFIREREADGEAGIPAELAGVIEVSERFKVGHRG